MSTPDLLATALADIDRAREHLTRYALETDSPALGAAEAADLLDAARWALHGRSGLRTGK